MVQRRRPPFIDSYLTAVYKDGLRLSQALPITVRPLQLWSSKVVEVTDYEETISSSRWVVQDPPERIQWLLCVPCPYSTVFILCIHMGEAVVCTTRCYVYRDGWWYYLRGFIPCWKSLKLRPSWGGYHQLSHVRMTQPPLWGGSQKLYEVSVVSSEKIQWSESIV